MAGMPRCSSWGSVGIGIGIGEDCEMSDENGLEEGGLDTGHAGPMDTIAAAVGDSGCTSRASSGERPVGIGFQRLRAADQAI